MPSVQIPNNSHIDISGEKAIIGSNANCDIVIENDSRIALEHAVIKSVAGRWMVETLTDGLVSVGDGKPARLCWLKPNDRIQLTSDGPELTFDPTSVPATANTTTQLTPASTPSNPVSPSAPAPPPTQSGGYSVVNERQEQPQRIKPPVVANPILANAAPNVANDSPVVTSPPPSSSFSSIHPLVWVGTLIVLLMLAAIFLKFKTPTIDRQLPPGQSGTIPNNDTNENNDTKGNTDKQQISSVVATPATLKQSIYSILIQDKTSKDFLRIGTAFAVSEHQLLTTGNVAAFLKNDTNSFPFTQVHSPILEKNYTVDKVALLPMFEKEFFESQATIKSLSKLRQSFEPTSSEKEKPKSKEELENISEQIIDIEEKLYQSFERQIFLDFAILEVKETLPVRLTLTKLVPAVNSKITVLGAAFPHDDSAFYSNDSLKPKQIEGRISRLLSPKEIFGNDDTTLIDRYLIQSNHSTLNENWMGSPILDSNQHVIGIYSRPTPAIKPGEPPSSVRFDSPSIIQIRNLIIDKE